MKPHPDTQAQTEYYNNRWQSFKFANHFGQERTIFILDALLSTGLVHPRICDLGSGPGYLSGILSAFGPCVGVELSDIAVEQARSQHPNVQFICADALQWHWFGDPFDVVVSQEVIEHIPDQSAYVDVIDRILRPGGYLILTTPNPAVLKAIPESKHAEWLTQPIEQWLERKELRRLLSSRFRVLSMSTVVLGHGEKRLHRLVNSVKLELVLHCLRAGHLWRHLRRDSGFGMYQTVVARKP